MRRVSIIHAFYKNPGMLEREYAHLAALPADLKAHLELVICDDASPKGFQAKPPANDIGLPVSVFRIREKTPWNWMGARNIAAHHATGDWLLFTDADHLVPEVTARRVTEGELDERNVYRFRRVDAPAMTPYKEHPNSWLMAAPLFRERFIGFDERWAGSYGSDFDVRNRLYAAARKVVMLSAPLIRVPREVVPDASTTDFGRKQSEFSARIPERRAQIEREGGPPRTMSFPYKRVA